jgi:hypothetical protein
MFYTTGTDDGAIAVTCDRCLQSVGCPDPFTAATAITHHHCDPDAAVPVPQDREPTVDEQPALHLLAGCWVASCPASSWPVPEAKPEPSGVRPAPAVPSATRSPDMAALTDTETRLVEDYLWVIDLVSRCAQGLDGGDWYYLNDKAQDLARRAERLADTAAEIAQAIRDNRPGSRPRREAVRAAVAFHGRHYRAGRLLHPQREES